MASEAKYISSLLFHAFLLLLDVVLWLSFWWSYGKEGPEAIFLGFMFCFMQVVLAFAALVLLIYLIVCVGIVCFDTIRDICDELGEYISKQ